MARFKGSKFKKKDKRPRGGGFGFTKSKDIKEFQGVSSEYDDFNQTPVAQHAMDEEDNNAVKLPKQPASFDQLSRISMTHLTNSKLDTEKVDESTEELGFFFDSTPSEPTKSQSKSIVPIKPPRVSCTKSNNYQKKKSKIIQDDSIYIDSEDDADDGISLSSSEDVGMLDALAHWGKTAMFQEESASPWYPSDGEEDYAILMGSSANDICDLDQDVIETLDSDEDCEPHLPFKWQSNEEMRVPESMQHSFRGLLAEERSRLKKQVKQQQKKSKIGRIAKMDSPMKNSGNQKIFDQILHEFIQKDHLQTYRLSNLSYHGRRIVVPRIAKMFHLDMSVVKSNKSIELFKTKKTCKLQVHEKLQTKKVITKREDSRLEKIRIRDNANHGKQVASNSTPISANNVGHRMLAAMGWNEGEAIGNNDNGIKEPVKVFMRANRRGLGA